MCFAEIKSYLVLIDHHVNTGRPPHVVASNIWIKSPGLIDRLSQLSQLLENISIRAPPFLQA